MLIALGILGWTLIAIGTVCLIIGNVMYRRLIDDLLEDHKIKDIQIQQLRAELITSFGETQTALEEKAKIEAYNQKLLSQLITQNNQGCRVNTNNPNIVRTQQTN